MKKLVQIFGMRCSGTNYLEQIIERNLEEVEICNYYGYKHLWNAKFRRTPKEEDNIYIVILVRNPYDWLRSIHIEPHHCPQLIGLPFKKFISAPWIAYSGKSWNAASEEARKTNVDESKIFEEFTNVIELRKRKLSVWRDLQKRLPSHVHLIRYEDLINDVESAVSSLADFFDVKVSSKKINEVSNYKRTDKKYRAKKKHKLSEVELAEINGQIDWSLERHYNYTQDDYRYNTLLNLPYLRFKAREKLSKLGFIKEEDEGPTNDNLELKAIKRAYNKLSKEDFIAKEQLAAKALEMSPRNEWALIQLGHHYRHRRLYQKALEHYQQVELSPINAQKMYRLYLRCLLHLNHKEELDKYDKLLLANDKNKSLKKKINSVLHRS